MGASGWGGGGGAGAGRVGVGGFLGARRVPIGFGRVGDGRMGGGCRWLPGGVCG